MQLKYLLLEGNVISVIPAGAFEGLNKLIHLELGFNKISVIEDGAFVGLQSLSVLDLYENEIVVVPEGALNPVRDGLVEVYLTENSLVCNCSMQWFHVWFVNRRQVFDGDDDQYNCSNIQGINMRTWFVS
jgi:Leucine-rich repeat (LRR) protein